MTNEEYNTAWVEATYIVAGWWEVILTDAYKAGIKEAYDNPSGGLTELMPTTKGLEEVAFFVKLE